MYKHHHMLPEQFGDMIIANHAIIHHYYTRKGNKLRTPKQLILILLHNQI